MPTVSYTGQIILPMQLHSPSFSIHKGVILDPSVAQICFPLGPMSMQVLLQFLLFSCSWSRPGTWHSKYQVSGWGLGMCLRKALILWTIKVSSINRVWKIDWLDKGIDLLLISNLILQKKKKACLQQLPFLGNLDCISGMSGLWKPLMTYFYK